MKALYTFAPAMFGDYELKQNNKALKVFSDQKEVAAAAEKLNIDIVVGSATEFAAKHGGKLNYYFKGQKLHNAKSAKDGLQQFVLGSNNLKRNGKASGLFVWYLLEEFVIHSIGFLQHDKQPYCNDFGDLLTKMEEFSKLYAPPLEYQSTPAMMEFLAK